MSFSFNERIPIYMQIIDEIKRQLATGLLNGGDKMPSVRELSENMNVNPNTVQRAYQELERLDITYTQRGMGTFVKDDENIIINIKNELAQGFLMQFVQGMKNIGMSKDDILGCINEYFLKEEN